MYDIIIIVKEGIVMKVKELIKLLQEADPDGEGTIRISEYCIGFDETIIIGVEKYKDTVMIY